MDKKPLTVGIIVLLFLVSIIPSTAQDTKNSLPTSGGKWWYVGGSGPGNYSIIQDAVDNASNGDTVFVYDDSSPYYHPIVIKKSICLMGEDRDTTIIDMRKREREAITIEYDNVTITGFTIQNTTWNGIYVLGGSSYINISNNNILYNVFSGIELCGPFEYIIIYRNIIRFQDYGIEASDTWYMTIKRNTFSDLYCGLDCFFVTFSHIDQNNFLNNERDVTFYVDKPFWWPFFWINYFDNNYWGEARTFPKIIISVGLMFFIPGLIFPFLPYPIINIDWHPAKTPFDIS